jgi:acyl-CoA thioesterase
VGSFAAETAVTGGDGHYRAVPSSDWEAPFGPLGGYVAAIALRAMGAETPLMRPASIHCQFLAKAAYDEMDVEVTTLRRGRRSHALHVRMSQGGQPIHVASGWVVEDGMAGLEHDHAVMPEVPPPSEVPSYGERAESFDEWAPVWRERIEGLPTRWDEGPGPPVWHTWMRLRENGGLEDPFLDAARSLMWMDLMMWNAACVPHLPWPVSHFAPNLDVAAVFHESAAKEEWLLCDCYAPVGREGLVGCRGRLLARGDQE